MSKDDFDTKPLIAAYEARKAAFTARGVYAAEQVMEWYATAVALEPLQTGDMLQLVRDPETGQILASKRRATS